MKKVIIFGTGKLSKALQESLNDKVDILAYADNNKEKWNTVYNDKIVINPNDICKIKYDYILIGSQYNEEIYNQLISMEIDDQKIFEFIKFIDNSINYIDYMIERAINSADKIETLVSGISYADVGFISEVYKKNAFNVANVSQDLFYDYNMVKYFIEDGRFSNINEVIIGMSYYSFQYDMSLSSMKSKVYNYYKNIHESHNYKDFDQCRKSIEKNIEIGKKLFYYEEGKPKIDLSACENKYIIDEKMGEWQAELDCKKNFPKTVAENKIIFKSYLDLLKKRNIKPIVVVFPVTKYYSKYFSERIEVEFNKIISEFMEEYEFQYIDYFKSNLFEEDDFRDVSHLNQRGAEKFTKILNEVIK